MADANSILDLIDGTLDDLSVSADAARWTPADVRDQDNEHRFEYVQFPHMPEDFISIQNHIAVINAEINTMMRSSLPRGMRAITVVIDETVIAMAPLHHSFDSLALCLADAFFANVKPPMSRRSRVLYGRRRRHTRG